MIGAALEEHAGAGVGRRDRGLTFLAEAPRIEAESERLRRRGREGPDRGDPRGHRARHEPVGDTPGVPWDGPIVTIADELQDTTVDAIVAGHTHRVSNLMVGDILVTEGINAGASYSVLQLWSRTATSPGPAARRASPRTSASRRAPTCRRSSTTANAETAALRNQVIGTQANDILRDPTRLRESEMGNLVADAMRAKYPGRVDAAFTNSGGLRADLVCTPPSAAARRRARSPGARCSRCCRSATAR